MVKKSQVLPEADPPVSLYHNDIANLYVGHIEDASATLETPIGRFDASLWGEVVLYRSPDPADVPLRVERLTRLAVRGQLPPLTPEQAADPAFAEAYNRIALYELAGPLEIPFFPGGNAGPIGEMPVQLHFAGLSFQAPDNKEYIPPQPINVHAWLEWEQVEASPNGLTLLLRLTAETAESKEIDRITFEQVKVRFLPVLPPPTFQLLALVPNANGQGCAAPTRPGSPLNVTPGYVLKLNFINFSTNAAISFPNLRTRLTTRACEVWCEQLGMQIEVTAYAGPAANPNPPNPHLAGDPFTIDGTAQSVLSGVSAALFNTFNSGSTAAVTNQRFFDPTACNVLIVDSISATVVGGDESPTGVCFPGDGYCVLDAAAANTNEFLLAHELGHLLKLDHPSGLLAGNTTAYRKSSKGSVMEPGNPNPSFNTLFNARMFLSTIPPRSGLILTRSGTATHFFPLGDFFAGDFQGDPGAEPSNAAGGQVVYLSPNLWNRKLADYAAANVNTRTHQNPAITDTSNHLYVDLRYTNLVNDPTRVYLYIGGPGLSAGVLQPMAAANSIDFSAPDVKELPWNPSAIWNLALLPPHSCVLAAAAVYDAAQPAITPVPRVNPSAALTFQDLIQNVSASNKIAQHNLNFQNASGQPLLRIMTNWIEFANPQQEPGEAEVEIDATKAAELPELLLEVDGERTYPLKAGERQRVQLSERFDPGATHVLRLRLQTPAHPQIDQQFPINLRFRLNQAEVGGYQHVIQIAKPAVVIHEVLSYLYGALLAVAAGCGGPDSTARAEALAAARRVLATLRRRARDTESPLRSLRHLAASLEKLAGCIDATGPGDCYAVRRRLYQLAGLLTLTKTSDGERIELIRAQVDRIYETASRMARDRIK